MPPPPPIVESKEITLRAALPDEGGLDEEELDTLREVEERLESNKVQLEYKDRKIVSIQQEVDAWAEKRRLRQRGGESIAGGGQAGQGQAGKGGGGSVTSDGKQAVRRVEVGEAQMIEELESGVSDLKGAKGIIRVLFSSLVAARRGLKQKAGAAKVFQVNSSDVWPGEAKGNFRKNYFDPKCRSRLSMLLGIPNRRMY